MWSLPATDLLAVFIVKLHKNSNSNNNVKKFCLFSEIFESFETSMVYIGYIFTMLNMKNSVKIFIGSKEFLYGKNLYCVCTLWT